MRLLVGVQQIRDLLAFEVSEANGVKAAQDALDNKNAVAFLSPLLPLVCGPLVALDMLA